ncbi:MAG: cystathionine gamma-synthase family protein [Fervidicoccaceae archaeon]
MRDSTICVHGHGFYDEKLGLFIPPIYVSTVYEQRGETLATDRGTELKYGREENPTTRFLERALAKLERGADSLAFNSGMAAISALLVHELGPGSRLLVPLEAYGSTLQLSQLLEAKMGCRVHFAWPDTSGFVEKLLEVRPHVAFVESITNPTLRVVDVVEVAKACRDVGCRLIVDNTFATPLLLKPLERGAHYVVHSLTKYLAGHNDVVGGVVVAGSADALVSPGPDGVSLWDWRRLLGSIIQPLDAFLALRGLKTLEPRFAKVSATAMAVAEFLEDHPAVSRVCYPGLPSSPYKSVADRLFERRLYGGVVSFEVKGGREKAVSVLKRLKLIRPSPSLGATESLMTYPLISASRTIPEHVRAKLGITDGLLRLSVGLEDAEDIIEDLGGALS